MVDQQDDERVKGHSFLIENILSREEKSPKTADRPTQITMAHITGQPEHSPRITDIQGIQFFLPITKKSVCSLVFSLYFCT
jgi:hypothetical protein